MAKQSSDQLHALRELANECGLTADDMYQHKQSGHWLIARTGIEKIQYKKLITVAFDAVRCEMDFAAVKATATKEGLTIQTFGSAAKVNCQVSYYLEMAEKRALSRAVLKLGGFYELGAYGEDEMPQEQPKAKGAGSLPELIIKQLQEAETLDQVRSIWAGLNKHMAGLPEVIHAKETAKQRLSA